MLTSTWAGRSELIGSLITNLNTVLHTFATRDHEFSDGLDKLSQLVEGLAQRKNDISTGLAYINAAAGSVTDLLVQARQPIKTWCTKQIGCLRRCCPTAIISTSRSRTSRKFTRCWPGRA